MKIAVMPDTHVPFHDEKSVELCIKVIKWFKPDVLVHIGDLVDFYSISRYDKNPDKDTGFVAELERIHAIMDRIDNLAPRKIFCEGNHEQRLQRYIFDKAPELYGYLSVETALQLKPRGWEFYPYQEVATIGKQGFVHDLGYAGVNACRQTSLAYPGHIIFGHSHRFGLYTAGNLRRDTYTCWNIGWLGDSRKADYLPSVKVKLDWTKGLMLIDMDRDGEPHHTPVRISHGRCMVGDKVFS